MTDVMTPPKIGLKGGQRTALPAPAKPGDRAATLSRRLASFLCLNGRNENLREDGGPRRRTAVVEAPGPADHRLAGLRAPSTTERADAPPSTPLAPPGESPLERLPHELHREINRYLTGDLHAMSRDVGALSRASRTLRQAKQADLSLHAKQHLLQRLIPLVEACFDDPSSWRNRPLERIEEFEGLVELLDPTRRERLVVDAVADMNRYGDGDKANALRQLAGHLKDFDLEQRARLLAAGIRIGPGQSKARAVAGFASSAHVSVAQRIRLAYAVSTIVVPTSAVTSLIELARALPHEEAVALQAPIAEGIDRALDFLEWTIHTGKLEELATALGRMGDPRCDGLADAVLALEHDFDRAEGIAAVGAILAHVDASRRARLVTAATGFEDADYRAQAIAGLGAGLAHLSGTEVAMLMSASTSLPDESTRAVALEGLSAGFASLAEPDRNTLFDTFKKFVTPHAQAKAIAALAPVMASLGEHQRAGVVASALGLPPQWRAEAIGSLGSGLAHLTMAQRTALVKGAIDLEDEENRAVAIAGLGTGAHHLTDIQRDELVAATKGIEPALFRTRALAGLAKGVASMPIF